MGKKEDTTKKEAGQSAAGAPPESDPDQGPTKAVIDTVEDLEACYPELVAAIKDDVVGQIGKCSADKLKKKLPELYERIVEDARKVGGRDLSEPGFLLEVDDPFAEGTLRTYQELKGIDGLRLPFVLPFKDKGNGEIREALWKRQFEKSEVLKAEFDDVRAFIAFKKKIVTQVLENYIQRADGAGDTGRADAAREAMKKIK